MHFVNPSTSKSERIRAKTLGRQVLETITFSGAAATAGNGTSSVSFDHDPCGNILTSTGNLATINPLRYRGYYYDPDTGFYYLQSRYYDPFVGRFINADGYASTGQGFVGYNMFAYCNNCPINRADFSGEDAILLYDGGSLDFGHIGALIQDSTGKWFHYYWGAIDAGTSSGNFTTLFVKKDAQQLFDEYNGDPFSLDEINCGTPYKSYTDMIYFEGDFSQSIEYLKSTADEKYSLYSNNCADRTLKGLAASNTKYSNVFSDARKKLFLSSVFKSVKKGKSIVDENLERNYR